MTAVGVRADRRSLLFPPFPIGRGGLVLPNRIWLPAMVTWRGTEDGFVTDAVREIYLRYARGGPGMIVLEATGIRDVASGPLLRLSHDRYVPGLAALVAEMKAVTRSLVVPQIIDFLKIARRKPTREFLEDAVRRGRLPARPSRGATRSSSASSSAGCRARATGATSGYGYRQTIEDLELRRDPPHPAAGSRPRRGGRRPAASTGSSCTSPTPTRWPRSSPSRTGAPTPTAAASRTGCACPAR